MKSHIGNMKWLTRKREKSHDNKGEDMNGRINRLEK